MGLRIAAYVWWIGIGNAGTLISCMLLLTRQRWRASINRFAEAMTLFAAAIAGLFPILHLGRPYLFYWLVPYPNVMGLWPQLRSPLVWDFFAIASYLIFSLIFWYTGLLPDLATMRDRARTKLRQRVYGVLALGWRRRAAMAALRKLLLGDGGAGRTDRLLRAQRGRSRLRRRFDAGLGRDGVSTLFSWWAPCSRALPWL